MLDQLTSLTSRIDTINQMPVDELRYAAIREFSVSRKMIQLAQSDSDAYIGLVGQLLAALPTIGHRTSSLIEVTGILGNAPIDTDLYGQLLKKLGALLRQDPVVAFWEEVDQSMATEIGASLLVDDFGTPESDAWLGHKPVPPFH